MAKVEKYVCDVCGKDMDAKSYTPSKNEINCDDIFAIDICNGEDGDICDECRTMIADFIQALKVKRSK